MSEIPSVTQAARLEPGAPRAGLGEPEFDFPRLYDAFVRALTWHDLTERHLLLSLKVATLSFGRGQTFTWVQFQTDLATMIAMGRSHLGTVLGELREMKVLQVTVVWDGYLITPMPPTRAWGWNRRTRFKSPSDEARSRQIETELRLVRWPGQGELLPEEPDFQAALTLEVLRASLVEVHVQAAEAIRRGVFHFPVMDGLPKPAQGSREPVSRREGRTPPQGTGCKEGEEPLCTPDFLAPGSEKGGPALTTEGATSPALLSSELFPKREQVFPKREQVFPKREQPINVLSALMSSGEVSSENTKAVSVINGCSRKRNSAEIPWFEELPCLDPGSDENQVLDWLRWALGADLMDRDAARPERKTWGGWWRTVYRNHRALVIDACQELRLRVRDQTSAPPRSRGGFMRDRILRMQKVNR